MRRTVDLQWALGEGSPRRRRDADLFWADLVGDTPHPTEERTTSPPEWLAIARRLPLTFGTATMTTPILGVVVHTTNHGAGPETLERFQADVKKATLVHELGHRLIAQLTIRPADLDEHRVLDLFLYDVWESLWGKDFADQQVIIESGRTGLFDYAAAWRWALSLSKGERASRFADIMKANGR